MRAGRSRSGERGIAIIAALWAAALVALVAVSVMHLTRSDARLARDQVEGARLEAVADGAVAHVILSLFGPKEGQPPTDGAPYSLTFEGTEIRASVTDESGRIDLNRVAPETLATLLRQAGLEPEPARDMAGRIVDWRRNAPQTLSRSGGADAYAAAGRDYGPRNAAFQSVAELKQVLGMTDALFRRIAPLLTVHSHSASVDPAFASAAVLRVYAGSSEVAREALERKEELARRGGPAERPGVIVGHAFAITVRAIDEEAGAQVSRRVAVRLTGDGANPLLIYRWD